MTIGTLALVHIPIVTLLPWKNQSYPGVILLPGALLDLFIIYGLIRVIEKLGRQ
jgi:hypothetical protein